MSTNPSQSTTGWRVVLGRSFAWLDSGLDWFERTALVVCISVMATVSVANVISRNTLGSSLQYANDVTQILLVLVTFLGIGIGARHARHIRVSAIHDLLPHRARKVLLVFVGLTTSGVLFLLAQYGWDYARSTQRSCRVLPESIELLGLTIPVGTLPLAIGLVLILVALMLSGHGVRLIHHHGASRIQRLGPTLQKVVLTGAFIGAVLLAAWLFSLFLELVANRTGRCRVTSSTGFPVYLVHMVVPLGFFLGGFQFLLSAIRNVISRENYLSWYQRDEYLTTEQTAGHSGLEEKEDADRG